MHGESESRGELHPFSFAGELAGAETVDAAVTAAVEATTGPFDQPATTVCSFDPDGEAVTCVDRSTTAAERPVPPPSTERIASVQESESALRVGETAEAESTTGPREPLREEIVAPVGSFGALSVGSTAAGAFDEDDVSIVEGIASALGSALDRIEGDGEPGETAAGTELASGDADDTDAAALGRLNELTTDAGDVDTTIEAMLSLGCDHLGLEAGILSRVEGTDYHVESVVDATGSYDEGATFALDETMCAATLANRTTEPLSFSDVRDTEHAEHPAAGGVRAYVGVPVVVDGETYGTVNFSSTTARENAFRPAEREFVTFIAGWIGNAIERRRRFAELERYETILEAVDDPVYALDTEGRFTFVNPAAKREFGYGEEILGEDVSIGMREEDIERISDARRALTETDERSVRSQFTLETAGGKERTVENRLAVIGDEEFRGTAGVLRDVTEREKRKREREATVEVFERAYTVGQKY
ncbi:MAG: GAF domain-containing protein [Halobacteriales archaeon]